ncbi:hypothetical protein CI109_101216 [Kwoniella shandongensis]|uniref:Uncharacterized protein n=1 Tax=Kwoniella shandongensis TaxID=1734106 RepID=A0A5M6BTK8_9TREE|nr:uncharacterized protein CI109_005466 [Kwoniella shandongensis]KAA5526188.1 hypothetical protein CI109_005466 [Kwoniella shandongensis]
MSTSRSLAPAPTITPSSVPSSITTRTGNEIITRAHFESKSQSQTPLASESQSRTPEKWEKVLWRRQDYPDNFVPPDFLSELDHLPPRPQPPLSSLIFASLPISQHIIIIAIFLAIFYALLEGNVSAGVVGWGCFFFGVAGFGVYRWGWGWGKGGVVAELDPLIPAPTPLRTLILPPLLLSLLSPVLGTLTSATTSDSIWPLAGGLGFVHLLLADFGTGEDLRLRSRRRRMREWERRGSVGKKEAVVEEKSLTSSLSFTSALSASVVLASRLSSTSQVFSLVLLAVLLFAGWPVIAKSVRESGKRFSLILTISTTLLAISLFPPTAEPIISICTWPMPTTPTVVFLVALFLSNLVGPTMLWYAWRWKTRRRGGWDVAVVRVRKGGRG